MSTRGRHGKRSHTDVIVNHHEMARMFLSSVHARTSWSNATKRPQKDVIVKRFAIKTGNKRTRFEKFDIIMKKLVHPFELYQYALFVAE